MRKSSAVFGCLQSAKSKTISQNISHKKSTNTILSYNQQPHMLSKNAQHYCIKRNFPIIVLRLKTQKKKRSKFDSFTTKYLGIEVEKEEKLTGSAKPGLIIHRFVRSQEIHPLGCVYVLI